MNLLEGILRGREQIRHHNHINFPTPPLLILTPVSSPFLPSSTSSNAHRGSFYVAVFLSCEEKNVSKQGSWGLYCRGCAIKPLGSSSSRTRGETGLSPLWPTPTYTLIGQDWGPVWKPQLAGPKPPEVRRQLRNSGGLPRCFKYQQCSSPTTHMITLLTAWHSLTHRAYSHCCTLSPIVEEKVPGKKAHNQFWPLTPIQEANGTHCQQVRLFSISCYFSNAYK